MSPFEECCSRKPLESTDQPKRLGAARRDLETWQEMISLAKVLSKKEEGEEETHAWHGALCCHSSPVLHQFWEGSGNGPCQSRHVSHARLWVTTTHQCSAHITPHRPCMLRNIQLILEHNLVSFYEIKRCQLQGCILLPFVT